MKTIKFSLAALAIIAGIGGAFATKKPLAAGKWSTHQIIVSGQTRLYLDVNVTGQTSPSGYICSTSTNPCTVELTAAATTATDANGTYVVQGATGVTRVNGIFTDL